MTIQKFREVLHANPLVPFTIHLADGRRIPVAHQDFVAASQTGRIVCVFHGPEDASSFIDIMLVTALELNPGAAPATSAQQ
jgi:hypothetical protein